MGWSGGTFTRTDGTRTGTEVWQEAEGAGVNIISSDHDVHDQDLANGINACLKKDGGNQPTADIPWNNNLITGYGDPDSRTNAARVAEVQDSAHMWGGTAGGTADALTLSLSPSISSYTTGLVVWFIANEANTGTATLNVDGQGATTLKKTDGTTDLAAGDLVTGRLYGALYDGTNFQVINLDIAGTVDTAQLADDAVTSAKIATDAVGSDQIAADAVDTSELAADAVTNAKIAADAVDTNEIADDAVTAAKIANAAINAIAKIASAIRSGIDATLITGTAGTNGNLSQWNADGDLVDGPEVLDEDDMSSNSASAVATQQSIKAYVDNSGVDRQVFTSDGTWNKPSSGTIALVEMWGGGASGTAGNESDEHRGGGGGEYASGWFPLTSLASSESVTVGDGGAAVSAQNNSGNPGEDSSFGSHLSAEGGRHPGSGTVNMRGGGILGGIDEDGERNAKGDSGGGAGGGVGDDGGDAVNGGAGGGGGISGEGGSSKYGGNGGDGDGSDGQVPGGGGGAIDGSLSGAGARGEVRVTVW